MQRFGQLIRLKPGVLEEYRKYHSAVWPDVLETITRCNIRNYSIYHMDRMLFAYFEYYGSDFAGDMAKMSADPATQRWWAIMMPMQEPYPNRLEGEWWTRMEEVFHLD